MAVRFYNTLTRRKEEFKPLKRGEARVYSCGPTVYGYAHIGNFRAYVFEDILCRVLRARGYRVHQIMNITDVDDKTIQGALREKKSLDDFTKIYREAFFEDLAALSIEPAGHYPRATEHVAEMTRLIQQLLQKGLAYESDGSIYYRISRFPRYGRLSRMVLEEMRPGGRVDHDEYASKEEVQDFCLWKKAREGEPWWDSPFGQGRPGWHIECSAMSMKYLGESFDIHTGGEDNIFPHHENEIAQSEGATEKPFVRTWMHCKFLIVDGEKMAKSKGNWYSLRDLLERGHPTTAVRYLLLSAHYRSVLNFTLAGLEQARRTVAHAQAFVRRLTEYQGGSSQDKGLKTRLKVFEEKFHASLDDDLNTAEALGHLAGWMGEVNKALDLDRLGKSGREETLEALEGMDRILGIFRTVEEALDAETRELVEAREEARQKGDYKRADTLRAHVLERGFAIEDTPRGPRVRKVSGVREA
ncbi:MAG: cysteine--tRNA ligase [Candidatus Omnitrophica bacterium]|nr:cysteine--tRNA ligase [Candidatus Omnitrophota bacterium]